MGIKPGLKGSQSLPAKPDRRQKRQQADSGNTPSLKPHLHKKGD